ncbi:MAG: response regulator, partial [Methylococcaceae bacterium]
SHVYDNIKTSSIRAVGQIAGIRHDQLRFMLGRAHRRAAQFAANINKHCSADHQATLDDCIQHALQMFVENELALGANLRLPDAGRNISVGHAAIRLIGTAPFRQEQLAGIPPRHAGGDRRFFYYIAVTDPSSGTQLTITYPIKLINEIFASSPQLGSSGEVFLADNGGFFVTPSRYPSTQGITNPISARPMRRCLEYGDGETLDLDYRDVPIIHGFRFIPEIGGGCIMAHIDQAEAFAGLQALRWKTLSAALLFCALAIIAAFRFSRKIVRPLEQQVFERTAELQASEARQFAIFNAAPDAMIISDEQGAIVMVNQQTECLLGYAADELIGQTVELLVPELMRTEHAAERIQYTAAPTPRLMGSAVLAQCKDGSFIDVEISLSPIPTAQGFLFASAMRDITERQRVEKHFARSNELLHHMGQLAKVGAWELSLPGLELYWSDEIYRIHEVDPATRPTLEQAIAFYAPEAQSVIRNAVQTAMSDGVPWDLELPFITAKGNPLWVRAQGSAVFQHGKIVSLVGAFQDITQQKQIELDLIRATQTASVANRAKSEFLANMSHEIRTPLNAILGLIYLVLDTPLLPQQKDALKKIYASSKALLNILNDILDYSKIEANRLELEHLPMRVEALLRNVADLFGMQIESKGLELFLNIGPQVPMEVIGDGLRLTQVLNNLVSNAIKFTERGEISIDVDVCRADDDPLPEKAGLISLCFAVRDTGIGLSKEQAELLFQPFAQADGTITRKHGGTGLGLAISQKLVGLMGGKIVVDSVKGRGSTFSFGIEAGLVPTAVSRRDSQQLGHLKVLVVDDYGSARLFLKRLLENWGLEPHTAASGEAALACIEEAQRGQHPFDVVLLDWCMPQMNGLEVVRKLEYEVTAGRLAYPPHVVMITAYQEEELLSQAGTTRLDAILTKPVIPSTLFDILTRFSSPKAPGKLDPTGKANPALMLRFDGAHILLVEDNAINQEVAASILKMHGLLVTLANHGGEALAQVQHQHFDAVLMDLHMPVMDGFEAARCIRELPQGQQLPIIAMTAAVMQEDQERCYAVGMVDFLAKPIDPGELLNVLKKWLPADFLKVQARSIEEPAQTAGPVDSASLPYNLPGFDLPIALRRLGGDRHLLTRLLLNFAEEQAAMTTQLATLLAQGHTEQAVALLHTLKGVANNLGAATLALVAGQLEQEIKAGGQRPSHQAFNAIMETAVSAIRRHVHPMQASEEAAIDRQTIQPLLAELTPFLQQRKLVPDELMQALQRLTQTDLPGAPLARLLHQIDQIDHDGALLCIAQITATLEQE